MATNRASYDETQYSTLNLGPTHPATHGIFQNVLTMDGEVIIDAVSTVGYIHRAFENHSDGVRVALKMAFQDLTKRTPNVKKHPSYMLMRGLSGFLNRTVPCLLTAHRFK